MARKAFIKARQCLRLKHQGKVSAARRAGCRWPDRERGRGRKKARRGGLGGHVRTCIQYKCVKGKGKTDPEAICKKGWVLRCAEYIAKPGIPRTAATRKPYQEFTYGRYHRGKGARALFPPDMPPRALKAAQKRFRSAPEVAVLPGPGRK